MAPTPSSKSNQSQSHTTLMKTPQSFKHRLQFHGSKPHPSPNPNTAGKDNNNPPEHPVEVIARIRDYPDQKDQQALSNLHINHQNQSVRVRADFGYRDFTLDGLSLSEEEDIGAFYSKFVESRVDSVRLGEKCTIMMYGPTGSGKSHTMFGCSKQPGIVYRSLKNILGNGVDDGCGNGEPGRVGTFVQVSVLEIYNEEIYDLLSNNGGGGGFGFGWPKGNGFNSKVRLEVMGKKAKNATYISGNEAGKISKEIQKVEKRRIVKSTLCNDRSSRSHCMIILDVPTVGGRLMLVDMAGSENIEQAGQVGFEAKMQTAKINQGNIALKRVVESIANGDSHVPFRDSKLTMLLQDSFEDDKSKILMILCASPDPKEIHKTISTLEYGAKAKCIVRGPHTPIKDKIGEDSSSAVILGSRIAAMDEFILKLQRENKLREREKNEANKELLKREEEMAALRAKLEKMGWKTSEEEINIRVQEQTQILKRELEKKLEECQRMANEIVELERRRMEETILQQQQEVEMLRRRLEEIEFELQTKDDSNKLNGSRDNLSGIAKRLLGLYPNEDSMVKSMDLDMDDQEPYVREVKLVGGGAIYQTDGNSIQGLNQSQPSNTNAVDNGHLFAPRLGLSTVYEEEEVEEEEEGKENADDEVDKEIIEEKRVVCTVENSTPSTNVNTSSFACLQQNSDQSPNDKDTESSRSLRIQTIFTLCGNHRELSHNIKTTNVTSNELSENIDPQFSSEMTVGNESVMKSSNKEILEAQKSPLSRDVGAKCTQSPRSPKPLKALENILAPVTPNSCSLQQEGVSPKLAPHFSSTPFITLRRH